MKNHCEYRVGDLVYATTGGNYGKPVRYGLILEIESTVFEQSPTPAFPVKILWNDNPNWECALIDHHYWKRVNSA